MSRFYHNSKTGISFWQGEPSAMSDTLLDGTKYVYFIPRKIDLNSMSIEKPYCGIVEVWQKVTHKKKFLGITIDKKTSIDVIAVFKIKLK